jgi:hypothetical protein
MTIPITINGREPKPRVINVKQYSANVDSIVFDIVDDELPTDNAKCFIAGSVYRQSIDLVPTATGGAAQWIISSAFTKESGAFDIQLEVTSDNKVWKSDVMLLIVSYSPTGNNTPSTDDTDTGKATDTLIYTVKPIYNFITTQAIIKLTD